MSAQEMVESDANHPQRLPDIFEPTPILASYNNGWNNVTLEAHNLPPGETPEYSLDRYVVSMSMGQRRVQVEQVIEGKSHQGTFFQSTVVICPVHSPHFFRWDNQLQTLSLNLKSELLNQNAIELLGTDCVELIPRLGFQDGLIYQIGLALQAELRSQGGNSRLYAETMANALAAHLLRHYSSQRHRTVNYNGGLSQHKLRLIMDYINDYLERELSLNELAAIAQMSQCHFCRAFKQAIGLSPHQYLIQQRVERAKQLLQQGAMTIAEVAITCGFTHQSHLHRHFKRLTGATPKTWLNS
ncbi:helix-turn-helix transcriptional regulator [Phormidium sp. FACHB-592]|uniref:AraC family transcriptional regulator n=1 Tax=Stenomitos frigidus AS-A4 TaxID=2933935 RepID=A0ABV0KSD9_9CYAN|nr:AraC family transcriptional regulator [Phormidium sp. FACHB-592]MBD2075831.1 helix-turn-helix transcriptional regulator [Phormidium sp. FACHB-592]